LSVVRGSWFVVRGQGFDFDYGLRTMNQKTPPKAATFTKKTKILYPKYI